PLGFGGRNFHPWTWSKGAVLKTYIVTCRALFDQAVISKLEVLGVYWTHEGIPPAASSRRVRHRLLIEAPNQDGAIQKARLAVGASGGSEAEFTCQSEAAPGNPAELEFPIGPVHASALLGDGGLRIRLSADQLDAIDQLEG